VPENVVPEFGARRRSSYSSGGDNCVDVSLATDGTQIRVEDSKSPADPPCVISAAAWDPLLAAVAARRPADLPRDGVSRDKTDVRVSLDLAGVAWCPAGPEAEYAFVDQVEGATYVVVRQATVVLVFTMAEWDAFVAGVRDGEFTLARLAQQQEDTPLHAPVRAIAAAARATVDASGLVSDELIADRRDEAAGDVRARH
jgi:hypothetical protein